MTTFEDRTFRSAERAKIDRWFTDSGQGWAFHTRDGRSLWIREAEVARWRRRGYVIVDTTADAMADARTIVLGLVSIAVVLIFIAGVRNWLTLSLGLELGLGLAAAAWPAWVSYRYFQQLYVLRGEIADSLAIGVPIPRDFVQAQPRTNAYRTALTTLGVVICLAALLSHIVPEVIDYFPPLAIIPIVAGAWALYFAAKAVDRQA